MKKKEYIIPIFVPHLGCPNDCSFCNQKSISGQAKQVTKEDVKQTIEEYLKNFRDDYKYVEVAFFGGSFTGIEEEKQEELLEAVQPYIQAKKVNSIRVSTRPDYIDKEVLKRMKKYHVKTIELGVQSSNDYILEKCRRGHTFADVERASKMIRMRGFILGHQMMVGLPDSTDLDEIHTAKDLIQLKPKLVRIYPVLVIKGTALEKEYEAGEYTPLNLNQAVERCKEVMKLFTAKNIQVIRIGLQNTESISEPSKEGSEVMAGPFHPAFRQLVESSLWYDSIVSKIKKINTKVKRVQIEANPENMNEIIGHKKENIEKLRNTYEVEIFAKANDQIKPGDFKINILEEY